MQGPPRQGSVQQEEVKPTTQPINRVAAGVLNTHQCDLEQVSTRAGISEGFKLLVPLHILDLNFIVDTHIVVIVALFANIFGRNVNLLCSRTRPFELLMHSASATPVTYNPSINSLASRKPWIPNSNFWNILEECYDRCNFERTGCLPLTATAYQRVCKYQTRSFFSFSGCDGAR